MECLYNARNNISDRHLLIVISSRDMKSCLLITDPGSAKSGNRMEHPTHPLPPHRRVISSIITGCPYSTCMATGADGDPVAAATLLHTNS
jgi:hypothetical protein